MVCPCELFIELRAGKIPALNLKPLGISSCNLSFAEHHQASKAAAEQNGGGGRIGNRARARRGGEGPGFGTRSHLWPLDAEIPRHCRRRIAIAGDGAGASDINIGRDVWDAALGSN